MGLLFGDTTVRTNTTVQNAIDLDVQNVIDTSGFAALIDAFKNLFSQQLEATQDAAAQQQADTKALTASAQVVQLLQVQAQEAETQEIAKANDTIKKLGYGALAIASIYVLTR